MLAAAPRGYPFKPTFDEITDDVQMRLRELDKSETRHIVFASPRMVVDMPGEWSMQYHGHVKNMLKVYPDGSFLQVCGWDGRREAVYKATYVIGLSFKAQYFEVFGYGHRRLSGSDTSRA